MTTLTIDGPAGAGKSTVARAVAAALGWRYVDSGAMYRALALEVLRRGVDASDEEAVGAIAEQADVEVDGRRAWLNGIEVSDAIRSREVTAVVSTVAANPRVRAALLEVQRALAATGDVVMEGRDIGTVVLPDADAKVYLTASVDERARRRALELGLPQDAATLEAMAGTLSERDVADATRHLSPLSRPPDARVVDTTGLGLDEVVERVCSIAREARDGR